MVKISINYPDDWHHHLRDGEHLTTTVNAAAKQFARVIVMPNLSSPVTNVALATAYRQRILAALEPGHTLEPLMTLYLTDETSVDEIREAKASPFIYGCKLYPAGATTNSSAGVTAIPRIYPILEEMQRQQLPLLVHGEVTTSSIDIFHREQQFIEQVLAPLLQRFPKLPVVLEHITTAYAVDTVRNGPTTLAATITPHHLLADRNDLLVGGIKPHLYCLPILKKSSDRRALIDAATSGNNKFFLGTDSAPHPQTAKESACGCAGIFSSLSAMELYLQVFEQENALDKLNDFASKFGPEFYGLKQNTSKVHYHKQPWQVPHFISYGSTQRLIPYAAGETLQWHRLDD